MSMIENNIGAFFSSPIIERVGWTLLHFVWQGTAVAGLLTIILVLSRRRSANVRYAVSCAALLAMLVAPVITLCLVDVAPPSLAETPTIVSVEPQPPAIIPPAVLPITADQIGAGPQTDTPSAVTLPLSPSWREQMTRVLELRLPWIVAIWLVGVLLLSLRLLSGWISAQRIRHGWTRPVDPFWRTKLTDLAERLKVRRSVQLLESALAQVPMVVGHLRPVILLPACALTGLTPAQLESILVHELAHIRRYDYLVNLAQSVIEVLLFYHPAVWWVSRRIRLEREHCCDDLAVAVCGDRLAYARTLVAMEKLRPPTSRLAVAARGGSLFGRIRRLVGACDTQPATHRYLAGAIVMVTVLSLAIALRLAGCALASHKDQKTDSSPTAATKHLLLEIREAHAKMARQTPGFELHFAETLSGTLSPSPKHHRAVWLIRRPDTIRWQFWHDVDTSPHLVQERLWHGPLLLDYGVYSETHRAAYLGYRLNVALEEFSLAPLFVNRLLEECRIVSATNRDDTIEIVLDGPKPAGSWVHEITAVFENADPYRLKKLILAHADSTAQVITFTFSQYKSLSPGVWLPQEIIGQIEIDVPGRRRSVTSSMKLEKFERCETIPDPEFKIDLPGRTHFTNKLIGSKSEFLQEPRSIDLEFLERTSKNLPTTQPAKKTDVQIKIEGGSPASTQATTPEALEQQVSAAGTQPATDRARAVESDILKTVEEFLASIVNRDFEKAYGFTPPEYTRDHKGGLEKLEQLFDLSQARISEAYEGKTDACIVATPIWSRDDKRTVALGFGLQKHGKYWLIRDIDFLPHEKAQQAFVDGFKKAYPDWEPKELVPTATQPGTASDKARIVTAVGPQEEPLDEKVPGVDVECVLLDIPPDVKLPLPRGTTPEVDTSHGVAGGARTLSNADGEVVVLSEQEKTAILERIQQSKSVKTIAKPTMQLKSGYSGMLKTGGDAPMPIGTEDEKSSSAENKIEYSFVGTTLTVTPTIQPDPSQITLDLTIEVRELTQTEKAPIISVRQMSTSAEIPDRSALLVRLPKSRDVKPPAESDATTSAESMADDSEGKIGSEREQPKSTLFALITPRIVEDAKPSDKAATDATPSSELRSSTPETDSELQIHLQARSIFASAEDAAKLRELVAQEPEAQLSQPYWARYLSDQRATDLMEETKKYRTLEMMSSPQVPILSGKSFDIRVGQRETLELPRIDQPQTNVSVEPIAFELSGKATAAVDRQSINMNIHAVDWKGIGKPEPVIEADFASSVALPAGRTLLVQIPYRNVRILGVREITSVVPEPEPPVWLHVRRTTTAEAKVKQQLFELVTEPLPDRKAPESYLFLMIKPKIVEPQQPQGESQSTTTSEARPAPPATQPGTSDAFAPVVEETLAFSADDRSNSAISFADARVISPSVSNLSPPIQRDAANLFPDLYDISGTVMGPRPEMWQEFFDKIAAMKSEEECDQFIKRPSPGFGPPAPQPAANVVVRLQGESIAKETVTDSRGQFKFPLLPRGVYQVTAEMPAPTSGRVAMAKGQIQLDRNRPVVLGLRTDLVNVRGRIIDINGNLVAGARVTGVEVIDDQAQAPQEYVPQTYSTVSGADGSYELRGLEPANWFGILPYLNKGKPGQPEQLDRFSGLHIRVEAPGLVQSKANVPRVPLVSAEQVDLARRFMKAYSQMLQRSGKPEVQEREGLSFPASEGNTITAADIVLDQAGTTATQPAKLDLENNATEQTSQHVYEVFGTVFAPVPESLWEDYFAKLEAVRSNEEFRRVFENMERPDQPAGLVGLP